MSTLKQLEAAYRRANPDGHYFDPDTLAWFGSQERQATRRDNGAFLYSENQTAAPSVMNSWRAVLFTADGVETLASATGPTRRQAIKNLAADHPVAWRTGRNPA